MCTSLISNRNKTIIGWNLDILDMEHRVRESDEGVYIEINDPTEGWLPLFGANNQGGFVGMPTCWPFDERSNPKNNETNIIYLDIDYLLKKKTFIEVKDYVENNKIASVPGVTFMSQLTNKNGDVLQIIPGQGFKYYEHPKYKVLTNFSPFKGTSEKHPWMGEDRYQKAADMLEKANDDFDVEECFDILKAVAQDICPTVVSMVYDVTEKIVYWCENQRWSTIIKHEFEK